MSKSGSPIFNFIKKKHILVMPDGLYNSIMLIWEDNFIVWF